MADQSTHIIYTFDEIQRYLQGKMSAAEMHAVEKAALQDPFLADAIEGYGELPALAAQQHLNEINASLSAERKSSKIVSFNHTTRWWRIAALVIVLAGVGVIGSYILKSSNQKQDVAQLKKEEAPKTSSPVLKDSQQNKTVFKDLPANEEKKISLQAEKRNQEYKNKPETTTITSESAGTGENKNEGQQANVTSAVAESAPSAKVDDMRRDTFEFSPKRPAASLNSPVTFSGKVVDENDQPVPNVVIQSADKKTNTLSDVQGNFSLKKNDSIVTVSTGAVGYENSNAELKPGDANRIHLKISTPMLNEVVVVPYGAKKSSVLQDKTASPVGGWENFNHYVVQQLHKDSTTTEYFEDEDLVKLEFSIDQSGSPYDFKFLQAQDADRKAKAIEILKQGPKWTSTSKKKKVRIGIAF